MRSIKTVVAGVILVLGCIPVAEALLVVGDSGSSSTYTDGAGAGVGWDYVGSLVVTLPIPDHAPSSVSYVSNGWFVTANHVWTGDVVGRSQETLSLGGSTYTINTDSYISITNASGTAADLCMFRVTDFSGLPTGMEVLESTPLWNDSLRLIGNGFDNEGNTGLTWGDGDIYSSGNGPNRPTYTASEPLNGSETTYYWSVYDNATPGSAYAQTYDSGGGAFVDGQLAGIMVAIGGGIGDGLTYITDLSVYGSQINATTAIPEPSVLMLGSVFAVAGFCIRRIFMI